MSSLKKVMQIISPVVDEIEENETNLDHFLPHVVVVKEAGVPKSNRDNKSHLDQNHSSVMVLILCILYPIYQAFQTHVGLCSYLYKLLSLCNDTSEWLWSWETCLDI